MPKNPQQVEMLCERFFLACHHWTAVNANEAVAAADNRAVHLANLMMQRNCESSTLIGLNSLAQIEDE